MPVPPLHAIEEPRQIGHHEASHHKPSHQSGCCDAWCLVWPSAVRAAASLLPTQWSRTRSGRQGERWRPLPREASAPSRATLAMPSPTTPHVNRAVEGGVLLG
jgi:hypothetical protein